ncbi:hypothetical protein [Listeria monocytogenes]|uniref:hypothetical protein n=1 Tax=Listeria monocytogenes TaxID=1639 RepID=UPI003F97489B
MKKGIIFVAICILALALSACGNAGKSGGSKTLKVDFKTDSKIEGDYNLLLDVKTNNKDIDMYPKLYTTKGELISELVGEYEDPTLMVTLTKDDFVNIIKYNAEKAVLKIEVDDLNSSKSIIKKVPVHFDMDEIKGYRDEILKEESEEAETAKQQKMEKAKKEKQEKKAEQQRERNEALANEKKYSYGTLIKKSNLYVPYHITKGQVMQAQEDDLGETTLLVYIKDTGYGVWDDLVMIKLDKTTEAVKDDFVEVWGEIQGTETYDTQIGGSNTVPSMKATSVRVIK